MAKHTLLRRTPQLIKRAFAESDQVKPSALKFQKAINDLESGVATLKHLLYSREPDIPAEAGAADIGFWNYLQFYRSQSSLLGTTEFTNPAWDLLLEVYSNRLLQRRAGLTDMANAAGVAPTTALRWYSKLEKDGWLVRRAHTEDRRKSWFELTPDAAQKLEAYFATFVTRTAVRGSPRN